MKARRFIRSLKSIREQKMAKYFLLAPKRPLYSAIDVGVLPIDVGGRIVETRKEAQTKVYLVVQNLYIKYHKICR